MAEKKEENIQIGMRVKQAREAARLTQERLAELLDVTAQYISGVERGAVGLSIPILLELSSILLVSCDFILLGEADISDVSGVASRLSRLPVEHIKNVEDIIDSGFTLANLKALLLERGAASVTIITLLNKLERREHDIAPDYNCFDIENEFVIGYGLDYNEQYRNLPYIGILKRSVYEK